MRVIAGDGTGDDRFDPDGVLLRLAQTIAAIDGEAEIFLASVDGIAPLFEAVCAAVVLAPEDGTLRVAASSAAFDEYARAVNGAGLALASDSLAADAVLTGSYVIDREPFAEGQR
ncbi:MAG TPA: hypothetical protein VEJ20_08595, partial [Candidatus Eremiobacteraceae bacterium]|nr:hypothetical protein [Candidatus Eremiobacteraceae bacterium]